MATMTRKFVCNPSDCNWGPCYLSFGQVHKSDDGQTLALKPMVCPAFPDQAGRAMWVARVDGKSAPTGSSPKGRTATAPSPKGKKPKKAKAGKKASPKGTKKGQGRKKASPKGKPLGATKIEHPSPSVKPGWSVPRDEQGKAKPYPMAKPATPKAKPSTKSRFQQARQALLLEGPTDGEMDALAILRMDQSRSTA